MDGPLPFLSTVQRTVSSNLPNCRGSVSAPCDLPPRLVVAGTSSGAGKTTVASALMVAFRRRGETVAAAKVGPDFIDTGYHELSAARKSRNLDVFLSGENSILPLAARAASGASILIVEGVMGLYDGIGATDRGSTAHIAKLLHAPVVLVLDASSMAGSVAALVKGFVVHDPDVEVAGVVLNNVGSERHEAVLRSALRRAGVHVFGALRRDGRLSWRRRHLGLVPPGEAPAEVRTTLDVLGSVAIDRLDLDALRGCAAAAPAIGTRKMKVARQVGPARIACATGRAFSFVYPDNLERFREAGAEVIPFDPLVDEQLPEGVCGIYAGGGFPEVFLEELAGNSQLNTEVAAAAASGMPIWAECGGMVWLSREMNGKRLCGVLDTRVEMGSSPQVGYRYGVAASPSYLVPEGVVLAAHEFHYTSAVPSGRALETWRPQVADDRETAATGRSRSGGRRARDMRYAGFSQGNVFASYLHVHMGADPSQAERFVAAARKWSHCRAGEVPRGSAVRRPGEVESGDARDPSESESVVEG